MNKEINMNEWLNGTTPLPEKQKPIEEVVPDIIELSQFKNFSQIKRGLCIRAPKMTLMTNPTGYQKFLNEVERAANRDGITLSFVDAGDSFIVTFK